MADKFQAPTKKGGRIAYDDYLESTQILNRGNNVPEMTLTEIQTAQAAEIAASRTFNCIVYNTTSNQLEYWHGAGAGRPI